MNYIINNIRNMAAAVLFGLASIALVSPACAQAEVPSSPAPVKKAEFKRFRDFEPEIRKQVLHLYMLSVGSKSALSDCDIAKCEKGRGFHKHSHWSGVPNADTTGEPLFESEDEAAEFGYRLALDKVWARYEIEFSPGDSKASRRKKVESRKKSLQKGISLSRMAISNYLYRRGIRVEDNIFTPFLLQEKPEHDYAKDLDEHVKHIEDDKESLEASAAERKMKEEKKENRNKKYRK